MYLLFIHYKHAVTQKLWVLVNWEPDYGKWQFRLVAILKNGGYFLNKPKIFTSAPTIIVPNGVLLSRSQHNLLASTTLFALIYDIRLSMAAILKTR